MLACCPEQRGQRQGAGAGFRLRVKASEHLGGHQLACHPEQVGRGATGRAEDK